MAPKTPHQVLGVGQLASRREIRRRYLELCKIHHPDVAKGGGEAFREIAAAYEQLTKARHTLRNQMVYQEGVHGTHFNTQMWTRRSILAGLGLAVTVAICASTESKPEEESTSWPHRGHNVRHDNATTYRQWRQR